MNILAIDNDPVAAARYHHTVHVRSQAGEAHQVLSDAGERLGLVSAHFRAPYNPAGRFARWCAASRSNAAWLLDLGLALCHEHVLRCGTTHAAESSLLEIVTLLRQWPDGDRQPFVMDVATTELAERHGLDPVAAYRARYVEAKLEPMGKPASWEPRPRPPWVVS